MLIPSKQNIKTITDMREDALGTIKQAQDDGFVYIFNRSEPKAVLMDIEEFSSIMKLKEDIEDYYDAIELSKEPRGEGIPHEKIVEMYE